MTAAVQLLRDCANWQDLRSGIDALPNTKQKGDCFELLVKLYLKLDPKYATKLKSVWSLAEVPAGIRKKLNLPASDEGIDLVGQTNDGQFWAIQAKYRSDQMQSLTRRELATFTDLAFSICTGFDLALVCTTTDRFSSKLKYHGDRLTFCAGDVWRNLASEFFSRLHQLLDDQLSPPEPFKPRPHQARAIESAWKHYVTDGEARGKLILPCGTGKSLAAFWIAQKLEAKNVLIAVPSLALVRQTLSVWVRECLAHEIDVHWIAVCSDPTVGDPQKDDAAVLTQDLGVDIQTDPAQIANWLTAGDDNSSKIIFATYQSGRVIADAANRAKFHFDLAVFDEAHRTVGKKGNLFSLLLFDENISVSRRLFMTATERRYSGRSEKIIGMESVRIYGTTFEMLSFNTALEADPPILSDYRTITIFVTRKEIDDLIQQNLFVKPDRGIWNRDIESQMFSALIALRKAMQAYPISHAISFHNSIARAKAFSKNQDIFTKAFEEFGDLDVFHVSGKMKTAIREETMTEFEKSERALVSNARCLSEGVDVPDINCVLFADPKRSTVDIVQAVGRALRPRSDGSLSYVIVPVEIEDMSDEVELQESTFRSVLSILRSLASNDERIIEYFRTIAAGKPWSGGSIPFEIVLPDSVQIDSESFVRAIEIKCWSKLGKLSWRPFDEARAFARSLNLGNQLEWALFTRGQLKGHKALPADVPATPNNVYSGKGWKNYSDWIGVPERQVGNWRPFTEARRFVRQLGIDTSPGWFDYAAGRTEHQKPRPTDIPVNPSVVYREKGWKGWGDFLGTGRKSMRYQTSRPFDEAREFARGLNLKNRYEWKHYMSGKRPDLPPVPDDIPVTPDSVYRDDGWISVGDWLGTGRIRHQERTFLQFEDARRFVRKLGLKNSDEWNEYCAGTIENIGNRPDFIPTNPNQHYKLSGWAGMPDWLGTGESQFQNIELYDKWRSYESAKRFAQTLELHSMAEWIKYCHSRIPDKPPLPQDIPTGPHTVYRGFGWTDSYEFLGKRKSWRSFSEAREFARSLGLKTYGEWFRYTQNKLPELGQRPDDIPSHPVVVYKNEGWKSVRDWLGTENRWRPFTEAREFARSLGLKSGVEWKAYRLGHLTDKEPRPADIPALPQNIYKDKGWIGWPDWLGTDKK